MPRQTSIALDAWLNWVGFATAAGMLEQGFPKKAEAMFRQEAEWIETNLKRVEAEALSPLLDIGSSTQEFRTVQKPHIHNQLFAPLTSRGIRVIYADLKAGEGIDVTADLLSDEGFADMQALGLKTILCCNVLEHVTNPAEFVRRCYRLLPAGGRLVVTVPRSYPYHRDPIDTGFRPDPRDIIALFDGPVDVEVAEIIDTGSYRDNLRARPWIITRQILRLPFPFLGWTKWKRSMKKFYWMVRPYRQSCIIVRKPPALPAAPEADDAGTIMSLH
jgi:SAM-dependent methyltransferase